ncbi:MAG: hypothetical protein WC536_03660 [Patescibacteria group bacterium]
MYSDIAKISFLIGLAMGICGCALWTFTNNKALLDAAYCWSTTGGIMLLTSIAASLLK